MTSATVIAEIETLCSERAFDVAIEVCQKVLNNRLDPLVEAQVRVLAGQALARLSRPVPALEQLRRAKDILAARPDPMLQAECADWEASCLYLLEDSSAANVAEQALTYCRAMTQPDPRLEARILEHLGSIQVRNHAFDVAIACYEQALEAAGSVRDLPRLARIYHGLGAAFDGRGDVDRAIEFVHKALNLYRIENDDALLARGENELGLLLLRQKQFARAEELFLSALGHFESSGTEIGRSHVLLSLGELYLSDGRLAEAVPILRDGIIEARRIGEPLAESEGHQLLAKVMESLGRPADADQEFTAGIDVLRTEGIPDRLAEIHAAYALVLENRSDLAGALRHLQEAAAILLERPALPPAAPRTRPVSRPGR